jgi:hypothetical protein
MRWPSLTALIVSTFVVGLAGFGSASAQDATSLTGRWTLNRDLSQFPPDAGFGADLLADLAASERAESNSMPSSRLSEDDAKRAKGLTEEVRNPSVHLRITDTPSAVTVIDDWGRSRTFHPNGREEVLQIDGAPLSLAATREGNDLVVTYHVQEKKEVRYRFSRTSNPPRLLVDIQFIEAVGRSSVHRVYDPTAPGEPIVTLPRPSPSAPAFPPAQAQGQPVQPPATVPAGGEPAGGAPFEVPRTPQRPGDELKGLTRLSVIVEDLGPQAAACGLKQATIEAAVAKSVTDGGLTILRNSDEATYLYVNINTSKVSTGFCVSRYDVMLFSHVTGQLPYGTRPLQVEASLLRDGGMTGGDAATNGASVLKAVKQAADQFVSRIKEANRQ